MKKPWKILIGCVIAALVLAIVGTAAYFLFFHNADLCVVEERKLKNTEENWLIGSFKEGDKAGFYHLCDVNRTADFSFKKDEGSLVYTAEGKTESSADELTTSFSTQVNGFTVRIMPADMTMAQAAALGFEKSKVAGRQAMLRMEEDTLVCLLPLVYRNECVAVTVQGTADRAQLSSVCTRAMDAIGHIDDLLIASVEEAGEDVYLALGTVIADEVYTLGACDDGDWDPYTTAYRLTAANDTVCTVYSVAKTSDELQAQGYIESRLQKKQIYMLPYVEGENSMEFCLPVSKINNAFIGIRVAVPAIAPVKENDETIDPFVGISAELLPLFTQAERDKDLNALQGEEIPAEQYIPAEIRTALSGVMRNISTANNGMKALTVQDRHIVGAKVMWLTALIEGEEDRYVKLADVNGGPTGYNQDKNAADIDGDTATSQFVYDKRGGNVKFSVYGVNVTRMELLEKGFAQTDLNYIPTDEKSARKTYSPIHGFLALEKETGDILFMRPSPYSDAFICIRLHREEGNGAVSLAADLFLMANKISPDTKHSSFIADFKLNFIDDNRWTYLWNGLLTTLLITLLSGVMGTVIGAVVASIRSTWQKNKDNMHPGLGKLVLGAADKLCKLYLTVIRGTPVMVQLLIMYLIIFSSASNGTVAAIVAFGINSGAYVAEIIRGGIMSIDNGQFEAGRSLGFNYLQTMWHIILPQVFKSILPTLANEFIALLKETSVSGYVAVRDLNKGGDIIRSVTYSAFLPLLAVAGIYLALVMFFTWLVGRLERRLRNSDH